MSAHPADPPVRSDPAPSGPGIVVPPPVLFVVGFVAGLLLDRVWPLPIEPGGTTAVVLVLAWALFLLGAFLLGWAMLTFFRSRTSPLPHHPASTLVRHGPYRFSRNPMYVALTAMYLGLALWADALWPVLLLPLVLLALYAAVIRREERYLTTAFGDAYREYRRRVGRWI